MTSCIWMYMDRYLARILSKLLKCAQFRRSKSYLTQGRYSSRPNQCWCFPCRRILKLDCLDLCRLDTTVHPSICACLRGLPKPHNEVEFDRIRMATCPIFASSGAKGVCPSGRRCRNRPRSLEPKCMACMEPDWSIHHSLCYALLSTFKILCNSSRHSLDSRAILAPTKAPLKPVNLSKIAMISCSKSDFCQTLRGFRRNPTSEWSVPLQLPHPPFGSIWYHQMKLVQLGQNYFPPLANLHANVKSSTQTSKPSAHQFLWMHEGLQAEDALSFEFLSWIQYYEYTMINHDVTQVILLSFAMYVSRSSTPLSSLRDGQLRESCNRRRSMQLLGQKWMTLSCTQKALASLAELSIKIKSWFCIIWIILYTNIYSIISGSDTTASPSPVYQRIADSWTASIKSLHCQRPLHCQVA